MFSSRDRIRRCLMPALALLAFSVAPAEAKDIPPPSEETRLLQEPTISKRHVVFVYAQDLWIVDRDGGTALRLTSHAGRESSPRLSPDGRWVAFSGEYQGNADVYVIPVTGGAPRRLTWHPGTDRVLGWHPDGKHVLFSSGRQSGPRIAALYQVPLEGGMPERLRVPRVGHAAYDGQARRLAYTPVGDSFRSWKRYRGGRTTPVWIYDVGTEEVEQVPHVNASDTFPCWIGDTVYFASDRAGEGGTEQMNVWRFDPGSEAPEQVTRFTDFGVRNMSAGDGMLVFTVAGAIRTYDPRTNEFKRLKIKVHADGLGRLPRWQAVKGFVRNVSVAPNGKRAVFEARGEIITVPREHGSPRNLTNSPGVHERSPAWSPDGKQIAWFSDQGGEYRLVVRDRLARQPPKAFALGGAGFYNAPRWSPDGKHVLFSDKANRIAFLTLDTGEVTKVSQAQGALGELRPWAVWSPDSAWIAFERRNPETAYDGIALYEVATGQVTPLTDGFSTADSPAFSKDGKHLFFRASVDSGPLRFGLDLSAQTVRRPSGNLYVVVLRKDGENPLRARSDEGLPDPKKKDERGRRRGRRSDDEEDEDGDEADSEEGEDEEDEEDEERDEKRAAGPSVDVEGIRQRILALPLAAGRYGYLSCSKSGLLFVERPEDGSPSLKLFDFKSRKAKEIVARATAVVVSADGRHLLVRTGSSWSLTTEKGKDRKELRIDDVKVRVEPDQEWPQILRECWRIQRDYFYDPNLHGIDWPKMWDRWSAFLPHVQHRADLNVVMMEMMGELCCGHEYVYGGDYPRAEGGVPVGLLGADFEIHEGRYRITRIYAGQNWNPRLRAPLTAPGVDVNVGDYLISVNGRQLVAPANLYEAFQNTADQPAEIKVAASPDGAEGRVSTVVPISSESRLRRMAWVEANRRRVEELSGGRLAYVYMPNTADAGLAAFDRDFYSQLDRQGLILDERFNGGGKVADYVVDVLDRDVICYWMNREGWLGRTPFGTLDGPKVMVINERAGSGGDCMPWMFKRLGIGPLVGTRTWGGLVGISGYPSLMDGGGCTAASFGIMDTDGRWVVENVGVAPDVEVFQWPKQVAAGGDPQLERAVAIALEMLEKDPPGERPGYRPPEKR